MTTITAGNTINELRLLFAQHGLPEEVVSDNGPQFASTEFAEFMNKNGIKHTLVPPYHPQSNGAAERSVRVVKEALVKQVLEGNKSRSMKHRQADFLIDTEEEKENSSGKQFIYYTVASHFVYIPRIKSNRTNQTYLQRSHIQYNQITTRDSLNLFFFFCFITQAPLRRILTIFSFGITIQHLQLRGIFGSNTLDKVGVKKNTFGQRSHKIIPGNNCLIIEE